MSIAATPTLPPGVTANSAVSSVLATATLSPNLGNPGAINTYPQCAQICTDNSVVIAGITGAGVGDINNEENACSATFRALTAGCEIATCSAEEYDTTQILAEQLCGSFYARNATLASEVSSAVASATAAARTATEGKDPADLANLPTCAQTCITQVNYGGCGSLSNLLCICQGVRFNDAIGPCELANCSPDDLQTTVFLAEKLCEPVGGVLTNPINYTNSSNTTVSPNPSPSPSPFTGGVGRLGSVGAAVVMTGLAVGVA